MPTILTPSETTALPAPSAQEAHLRDVGLDAIARRSVGDLTAACDLLAAAANPGAVVALAAILEGHADWPSGCELPVRALAETRCPGASALLARVARPWPRDGVAVAHLCRVFGARREPEALPFLLELAGGPAPARPGPPPLARRRALCAAAAFEAPEARSAVARALDRPGDAVLEAELLHAVVSYASPARAFALLSPWFEREGRSRVGKAAFELARHAERGGALDPRWREIVLPRYRGGDTSEARHSLPELVAATARPADLVELLRGGAPLPVFLAALARGGDARAADVAREVLLRDDAPKYAVAVAAGALLRLGGAFGERERRALVAALADRASATVARALEALALLPIDERRSALKAALSGRQRASMGEPDLERIRGDVLLGDALEATGGEPPEPASAPPDGRYPFLFYGVTGADFFEGGYAYELRFASRPPGPARDAIWTLLGHGADEGDRIGWADDWAFAESRTPMSAQLAAHWQARLLALHAEHPLLEVHGLCWPARDAPPHAWETWSLARQPVPSAAPAWRRHMRPTPFEPLIKRYPAAIEDE